MKHVLTFILLLIASSAWGASATFTPDTTTAYHNPERGFYYHLNPGTEWCASPGVPSTLLTGLRDGTKAETSGVSGNTYYQDAQIFYYEWTATGSPSVVDADLLCARAAGVKVLFTGEYCQGAPCNENRTLSQVIADIQGISATLYKYRDVLLNVRAGFIGGWGQWVNSSTTLINAASKLAVWNALVAAVPPEIPISVQYPYDAQTWYGGATSNASNAFVGKALSRMMVATDCFMSSPNDRYTYPGAITVGDTSFTTTAASQRAFFANQSYWTGFHTETCAGDPNLRVHCLDSLTDDTGQSGGIMNEGPRYHMTSNHRAYYNGFHDQWLTDGCYAQVNNLMGYRFEFDSIVHPDTMTHGTTNTVTITLKNYGWARIMSGRQVMLHLVSGSNNIYCRFTPQLRTLPSQATASTGMQTKCYVPAGQPVGSYAVYLEMPDIYLSDNLNFGSYNKLYNIQPANANNGGQTWDATNRRFATGTTVTIN